MGCEALDTQPVACHPSWDSPSRHRALSPCSAGAVEWMNEEGIAADVQKETAGIGHTVGHCAAAIRGMAEVETVATFGSGIHMLAVGHERK